MPLPTSITDLSQTASANFPNGAVDSPASLDDVQRAHASFIALLRDGKGMATPVTLTAAATTDIGAQNSLFVEVSGTTTITSFGSTYSGERIIRFTGALTLTHNATTLILPGGANITTAAGDALCAVPTQAGTGWAVVFYQRANGQALAGGEAAAIQANTYIAATASGTNSYTITPSPAISAYAAGQEFLVTFTNGNTTAATLQVSGLASPPSIVKQDSTGAYVALVNGDIPASHRSRMRMLSTTQVQLVDTVPSTVSAASTSAAGIVELADSAEAAEGIVATRAITPSTLRSGVNATGTAPIYAPRAWVNFNGTGTVAIRASGNVSSITDNAVGDYTVNFSTALPDSNFSVQLMSNNSGGDVYHRRNLVSQTASSVRVTVSALAADDSVVCVAVVR
jgi:hypothetical protein